MALNIKKDLKDGAKVRQKPDLSTLIYGKVPPQAKELEEAVLGAMMIEKDKLVEVFDIIQYEEVFYVDAHQKIFAAIKSLYAIGSPVDLFTVQEQLKKANELELVGGAYYITKLSMTVVSAAHVESHARILMEKYIQREIIRIAGVAIGAGYEDSTDAFDLLGETEASLFKLSMGISSGKNYLNSSAAAYMAQTNLAKVMAQQGEVTGVHTGWGALNRVTGGWQKQDLIILAARPSVGKTAFALNLLVNAGREGQKVGFFSLEMGVAPVMSRLMSTMSGVPLDNIIKGEMSQEDQIEYAKACNEYAKSGHCIDETPAINLYQLRGKARRMVLKEGISMIIVDYIQLMGSVDEKGNREQEISKISRGLKQIGRELGIPVIALSQLNRETDKRAKQGGSNRPQLSDLRESGAIEQDADMVLFLSRPDYQIASHEVDDALRDDAFIHIAKYRNGETIDLYMKFVKKIQKWMDKDQYDAWKNPYSKDTFQFQKRGPVLDPSEPLKNQDHDGYRGSLENRNTDDKGDDLPF